MQLNYYTEQNSGKYVQKGTGLESWVLPTPRKLFLFLSVRRRRKYTTVRSRPHYAGGIWNHSFNDFYRAH